MLDIVKQLFENNVISEEMQSEIETAWQSKIQESRNQLSAELREEFAQKYEHDKGQLTEAVETMISERLQSELSELAEDRAQLIEARANYVKKMKKDQAAMESFVFKKLKQEIAELHEDRNTVAENIEKLESFIVEALAKEIAEFHIDKADLAETKVKLVRDSKAKFESIKKDFIKAASGLVQETVSKGLRSEMSQLKEDIDAARKNDFGRRIFESFASEYVASHLNEKSETAKLAKQLAEKEVQLSEAAVAVQKKEKIVESKELEIKRLHEADQRKAIMSDLLSPLRGDKRSVMSQLLESTQTEKLQAAFDKYLPAVLDGNKPAKKQLVESKSVSGDKKTQTLNSSEKTADIVDIRRLAGLKN